MNIKNELFGELHEQEENGLFGNEHRRQYEAQQEALRQTPVVGIGIDWDKFANALKDEFGESLVEEDGGEEDAYNWWLTDVTVTDIVEFIKNYR